MKPVLIVGGGLAGLSSAYHLKKESFVLIERESDVGGTARSFSIDGFTFDFTGHLLHLHTDYTRKLIASLLKGNIYSCVRNAAIYSSETYTAYPFQANTYGLPAHIVQECVLGFLQAQKTKRNKPSSYSNLDFRSWCLQTFGVGISKHFMLPYNEKLYQTKASQMSSDWCGPFVPTPNPDEVIRGAISRQDKRFGYNTTFIYPRRGGIQALPHALARNVRNLRTETSLKKLDWRSKKATLSTGETIEYSHAISSIPLIELLNRMERLPETIKKAKKKLKCVGVLCLNMGINRAKISDKSWIYFPEKKFPFYRVGFPMNFTPHAVPRGCSSMYVEIPLDVRRPYNKKKILRSVRRGLIQCGLLRSADKILVAQFLPIRYAYVIYNQNRPAALQTIFRFLHKNRIQSIGRYGGWKYSFMEEAILDGKKAAETILRAPH